MSGGVAIKIDHLFICLFSDEGCFILWGCLCCRDKKNKGEPNCQIIPRKNEKNCVLGQVCGNTKFEDCSQEGVQKVARLWLLSVPSILVPFLRTCLKTLQKLWIQRVEDNIQNGATFQK